MARLFLIIFLSFALATSHVDARVLSGSRTERKINRKIERLLNSARKQYDTGKVQQALDTYWKILEIDPQETFAYLELGEVYYELKIYGRAIELLEPGCKTAEMEIDPETVCHYYCVLTNAYVQLKQLGKASRSLIKAAEASPKNPLPRKILGDIYLANNRIKSAYKAYKKALSFDPNYEPALEKIGELTTKYNIQVKKVPSPVKKLHTVKAQLVRPSSSPISDTEKDDKDLTNDSRPVPMGESEPVSADNNDLISVAIIPMPASNISPTATLTPDLVATKPASDKPAVDQEEVDEQLDRLLAGSVAQKKEATDFFVSLKNEGIAEVEELLYDSDPEVRMVGVRALTAFKDHKDRVITILRDSSDDPDPEVQKEIQGALGTLK